MGKVKLGDICTINGGYAFKSERFSTKGIPIIRIGNITIDGLIIDEDVCYDENFWNENESYRIGKNDILIAMSGATVGKSCMNNIERKLLLNQRVAAINCNNNTNLKYIFYCIDSENFTKYIETNSIGCAQPNISLKQISNFEIPAVCEEEQKRIVDELDKVTFLIDKRKEQLSKLNELVKTRYVELFGDPVENPYGWEQTTLKNIAIGKLSYGSGASACEYDGNIRYVRITDIDNSGRLNDDAVSPSAIEEKYILNDGDILFARSGATVGKSYRYRECDGKCLYAGYLIRLVPNTELVLPDYVFYYTKTSYYERFIASNMKVVAQPNINAQQYGDLTICIPPMELQKNFLSFVELTDKSKLEVQKSLEKLELLKKALMQKYFG